MVYAYEIKISDNIIEDNIGQLICLNVPIARSGTQDYLEDEINGNGSSKIIKIERPWPVVKDSIPTFEGKPFIKLHPGVDIDVNNIKEYTVGHVQNVRADDEKELIVADILVFDVETINLIKNKKMREISCGYFYEQENNVITKIIGEHVALVQEGRAGNTKIIDSSIKSFNNFLVSKKAEELKAGNWIYHRLNDDQDKEFYEVVKTFKSDINILVFVKVPNEKHEALVFNFDDLIDVLTDKSIETAKKAEDALPESVSKEPVYIYHVKNTSGSTVGYVGVDEKGEEGISKKESDAAIFTTPNWWTELTSRHLDYIKKILGDKFGYLVAIKTDLTE